MMDPRDEGSPGSPPPSSDEFPDADKVELDDMPEVESIAADEPEVVELAGAAAAPGAAQGAAGAAPRPPAAAPAPPKQHPAAVPVPVPEPCHSSDELRQASTGYWYDYQTFRRKKKRHALSLEHIRQLWECAPRPAPRSAQEPPSRCLPPPLQRLLEDMVARWGAERVLGQAAVDALLALPLPQASDVLKQMSGEAPGVTDEAVTARCVELARRAPGYQPPERRTVAVFGAITIPEKDLRFRGDRPDLNDITWACVTPVLVGLTVQCGPVLRFALAEEDGKRVGTFEFVTTTGCEQALAVTTICERNVATRPSRALERALTLTPETRDWLDAHRGGLRTPEVKLRSDIKAPAVAWQHHCRQLELWTQRTRRIRAVPVSPGPKKPAAPPARVERSEEHPSRPPPLLSTLRQQAAAAAAGAPPQPRPPPAQPAAEGGAAGAAARTADPRAFSHSPLWGSLSPNDHSIFVGRYSGDLALAVLEHLAVTNPKAARGAIGQRVLVVDAEGNVGRHEDVAWELLRFGCQLRGGFWRRDNKLGDFIFRRNHWGTLHWTAGAEPDAGPEQGGPEGECSAVRIGEALAAGERLLCIGGRVTVTVHDKVPHRQWPSLSVEGLQYVGQEPVTAAKFPSLVVPGGIFPDGATTYVYAKTGLCGGASGPAAEEQDADSRGEVDTE